MKSKGRPRSLTSFKKAEIIEYWVNNRDVSFKYIAMKFRIPASTLSMMITRDYLPKQHYTAFGVTTITLQSKINEPELITID